MSFRAIFTLCLALSAAVTTAGDGGGKAPRKPAHHGRSDHYVAFARSDGNARAPASVAAATLVMEDPVRGIALYRLPRGVEATAWKRAAGPHAGLRDWPCYRSKSSRWVVPTGSLLVKFRDGISPSDATAFVRSRGHEMVGRLRGARIFEVSAKNAEDVFAEAEELAASPLVEWAQPDCIREVRRKALPNDTNFPLQWYLHNTGQYGSLTNRDVYAVPAWDITRGTATVTIAVIDDGIDMAHPDLTNNIYANPGETGAGKETNGVDDDANDYVDDWRGWDFVHSDNNPSPVVTGSNGDDHGTWTAGLACGTINNALGIAGIAGECRVMSLRVVSTGSGMPDSVWANALMYAADMADVITMGYYLDPTPVITDAINYVVTSGRGGKGAVFCTAMGNDGVWRGYDTDAGTLPQAITVSGTSNHDRRSFFSDYGASLNMVAPAGGGNIQLQTTDRSGTAGQSSNDYMAVNGTSFAAPLVAGAAALVVSAHPDWSGLRVRRQLEASCDRIDAAAHPYNARGWNSDYGCGRLNAFGALTDPEDQWDTYEPDDSASATAIEDGELQYRAMHSTGDVDYARFSLSRTSDLWLTVIGSTNVQVALYSNISLVATQAPGLWPRVYATNLPPGGYVAQVSCVPGATTSAYGLHLSVLNGRDQYEPDDSTNTASLLLPREHQLRSFYPTGDIDTAYFTLTQTSAVSIRTSGDWAGDTTLSLRDAAGTELAFNDDIDYDNGFFFSYVTNQLSPGTYYVVVEEYDFIQYPAYLLTLEVAAADLYEPDPVESSAVNIAPGDRVSRTLWPTNDTDWFTFSLSNTANIALSTDSSDRYVNSDTIMTLYRVVGGTNVEVGYDDNGNGDGPSFSAIYVPGLTDGVYRVKVQGKTPDITSPNYFLAFDAAYRSAELRETESGQVGLGIEWQADPSYNYRVEWSSDLSLTQSWQTATNIEGRASVNRATAPYLDPTPNTQSFFRVIVE